MWWLSSIGSETDFLVNHCRAPFSLEIVVKSWMSRQSNHKLQEVEVSQI